MESSTPGDGSGNFEPIQGHSANLGRINVCIKTELPTFCSGNVIGCVVESEYVIVTTAIDWS
jgi:hypothetical protein